MSIVLATNVGPVIKVGGLCYEIEGTTNLPVTHAFADELHNTCEDCESEFSASEFSASESLVTCNDCDPPLAEQYAVTFSGLEENFNSLNGTWVIDWDTGCTWWRGSLPTVSGPNDADIHISWAWSYWRIELSSIDGGYVEWHGGSSTDTCDPLSVSFTLNDCNDGMIGSPWCTGATPVVSVAGVVP